MWNCSGKRPSSSASARQGLATLGFEVGDRHFGGIHRGPLCGKLHRSGRTRVKARLHDCEPP